MNMTALPRPYQSEVNKKLWNQKPQRGIVAMKAFEWQKRAKEMDENINCII